MMVNGDLESVYDAIARIDEVNFPGHSRSVRGNVAQLLFRAEAAARGFVPCFPAWNIPLDHILLDYYEMNRLIRVEIKQSMQGRSGVFTVELRSSQGIGGASGAKKGAERVHDYGKSVDVLAVLLPSIASWYLIPVSIIRGKSSIRIRPNAATCRFSEFRNAWKLLRSEEHVLARLPSTIVRLREKYSGMRKSGTYGGRTLRKASAKNAALR